MLKPIILFGLLSMQTSVTLAENAYDFTFKSLVGHQPLSLHSYKGNVLLVVNTASKCGYTSQYKGLEALYQKYKNKGLVIIGIPSNDFGRQEPENEKSIADFCQINFGVTFPMTTKESVTGKSAHPFYQWAKKEKGVLGAPKWNFHKYLINRQGKLVNYFYSFTAPDSPKVIKAIEKALDEN